jgi:hypothetical protein
VHQQYIADIEASAREALASVDPTPFYVRYGENVRAGVKAHLDTVTDRAAAPIIAKYTGVLAAADIEIFTWTTQGRNCRNFGHDHEAVVRGTTVLAAPGGQAVGVSPVPQEVPVRVTDRWAAFLRRRADAQVSRANLAAMRHGLLPPGWVYGLNDQRQAEFDEQRRILFEISWYLFREPVTGPDGVPVAIWYEGTSEYRTPLLTPPGQWPGSPPDRLAAVTGFGVRVLNRIIPGSRLSFVVQAHAMSGPPAAVTRRFPRKQDAAAFAAELGRRVRADGVGALRHDA